MNQPNGPPDVAQPRQRIPPRAIILAITSLLLIAVAAVFGALNYRQATALRDIEALGGTAGYFIPWHPILWNLDSFGTTQWTGNASEIDLSRTTISDDDWLRIAGHLRTFPKLRRLSLWSCGMTDERMRDLKELRGLEKLHLSVSRVGDESLINLTEMKGLETLELNATQVTGAGITCLQQCPSLARLLLKDTPFRDEHCGTFGMLPELIVLDLGGTGITDAGLSEWASHPPRSLEALFLERTAITDAGLSRLGPLPRLISLDLGHTAVTDAGIPSLLSLTNLRYLNLKNTSVTDAGLRELKSLPHLDSMNLSGTRVTAAGIDDLRQTFPAVQVETGW